MNIYLIGYRCTGKTTLGRALARRIGWTFADSDDIIVAQAGASIADMVARHGWPYFRRLESGVMARLAAESRQVVATGGGVVLDDGNVDLMRASGKVVWLQARAETIRCWIEKDRRTADLRPALTDRGLAEEIEATLAERAPLYEKAMNVGLATDDFDIDALCGQLIERLKPFGVRAC